MYLQTQYVFVHNALDELVTCGDTEIAAVNMRITIGKLSRTVKGSENISGIIWKVYCNTHFTKKHG